MVTKYIKVETEGETEILDITDDVARVVENSKIQNGIVTVFVIGSTAALTTMEYEPGLVKDFPDMLQRIAPKELDYEHEKRWHDGNGHSHVRASLVGPSITIPIVNGTLAHGTWQQIVLIELDVRHRSRKLLAQIMGD